MAQPTEIEPARADAGAAGPAGSGSPDSPGEAFDRDPPQAMDAALAGDSGPGNDGDRADPPVSAGPRGNDPREAFWNSQGYQLFWHSTPSDSDLALDAKTYFTTKWNGRYPLKSLGATTSFSFSVAKAPDGSPSIRGFIPKGDSTQRYVVGNQFGPRGPEKQMVASLQWFNPCPGGVTVNGRGGAYVGFGPIWGSADDVDHYPGGSVNYDDSWNFRVPVNGYRNDIFVYAYLPGNSGSGDTMAQVPDKPACNRWQTIELQIVQNDLGKKNGVVRLYLDGKLAAEIKAVQTRVKPTVRPKGFGIMLKHNAGAPDDETYYYRHFRMYVN